MSRARINADQAHTESLSVVPHIIPGVLYPAVAGKLLNGATHSGAYGTAQTQSGGDGHKYYYTDIKGSKAIKDPRIGGHFGSQRHKFKSIQLLEQETATHGKKVYSIDGRESIRVADGGTTGIWLIDNSLHGHFLKVDTVATGAILEITGFFNDINFIVDIEANRANAIKLTVNGTQSEAANALVGGVAPEPSPLGSRYVDKGSIIYGGATLSASLGIIPTINTLKYEITSGTSKYLRIYGIELIAQDTTDADTKLQIQIPSQNVVSYGKKFTVTGTPHYNPFAFKTDGTTAWTAGNHNGTAWPIGTGSSANIDTATSLGLDAWVSTNYYYPYNGGRVVWWIDSSGTLKCSVNMMPPNARNVTSTPSNEKGDDSAGTTSAAVANTQPLPTFTDIAIDHSQAEVAKTFYIQEFGNGAANHGTNDSSSPSLADASMLSNTADVISYVMDDGLTSHAGTNLLTDASPIVYSNTASKGSYITFIGTGFTFRGRSPSNTPSALVSVVQNLPYGTHIIKIFAGSTLQHTALHVDGVEVYTAAAGLIEYGGIVDVTFHQPKMPPIPEDAVVLADYMLMADNVPMTALSNGSEVSKGVRLLSTSRDVFTDRTGGDAAGVATGVDKCVPFGLQWAGTKSSDFSCQVPFFGTKVEGTRETNGTETTAGRVQINASNVSYTAINSAFHERMDYCLQSTASTLGNNIGNIFHLTTGQTTRMGFAIPIHTSSHYQTFETPFLHELVGGDRNMEQTNLVVTPDGKTWDKVTRDISYIGMSKVNIQVDGPWLDADAAAVYTEYRGTSGVNLYTKDFTTGYDRLICLVSGMYEISFDTHIDNAIDAQDWGRIKVNGTTVIQKYQMDENYNQLQMHCHVNLQRGDYIQFFMAVSDVHTSSTTIKRL